MSSDPDGSGGMEEENKGAAIPVEGTADEAAQPSDSGAAPQTESQVEGRRTQLKVVRENIQALAGDIGDFRKSHEGSIKRLEKQVADLRSELTAQKLSKDVGSFRKSNEANSKRLEKQVATLRKELAALKSGIAKDAARSRAKQEATLAKILAKVSAKPKPAKSSKKR